jgi:hypothetical protein
VPVTFIPRNNTGLEAKRSKRPTWLFRVKLEAAKTAVVKAMFIHVYLRGESSWLYRNSFSILVLKQEPGSYQSNSMEATKKHFISLRNYLSVFMDTLLLMSALSFFVKYLFL